MDAISIKNYVSKLLWGKRTLFDIYSNCYCKFGRILVLFTVVEDSLYEIYTSYKIVYVIKCSEIISMLGNVLPKTLVNRFSN